MTRQVRLRPEAEVDLEEAASWYEAQQPGLGNAFLDEVQRAFVRIAEHADAYPILHRDTRRILMFRFPFGIYDRVHADAILVIAVMHGSRSPRRWKQRT